jgi:hypothetical protein
MAAHGERDLFGSFCSLLSHESLLQRDNNDT